ncbi:MULTISPECIES: antibiotic biosynthesis monooxygenase family protein [Marinobacter]|uniref:Antibiotic biosynthesis monooxygenase n=1 Tax=Marinobacter xestospongiae TaxID=994319 RepID=A0ABU3VUV8_9GAMM|nr:MULTISPECIES: antibiotic biosynthesis monooxygenase [Marinobacter]MCG8517827.1 antibiotic biosynthesis monooxygenase [Pseudomonadales bacterium]MCK7565486.1 antibiotic biosynthesis monooxygenase [Marinobacter xestospongiae]MDV2077945.1 antibiotic biosynthesis monooxygenase [Marinobacter xestospongiae]UDL06371.1 antibiotic biosynthesis monooxygenase [Marinobacter sp. CA1]
MYIAMNRFRITPGKEQEFIEIWQGRDSYLDEVPGIQSFHLLQGPKHEDHTLFSTHTVWDSEQAFIDWTKSEAFKKAHANAKPAKDLYLGPPQFEGFESVL